jgi:CRP-like cAMP-binding protein
MEELKKHLLDECTYRMRGETMDKFLGLISEEIELKRGEALIPYGKFDNNIYVLKSGIIRSVYFDGLKETTHAFAMAGTLVISYYSFYMREPSFSQMEACCDSVVLKITKDKFDELVRESHDFAQWMLSMSLSQLWFYEKKRTVLNGDAKECFESLMRNRPEILEKVQAKIIASYIGVTPQYLSKLKRNFKI